MPNKLTAWNAISGQGNPTRSIEVNELIKKVKKKEVRKQGAPSKTRRSMTIPEFVETETVLMDHDDITRRYGIPSFLKFQFHMRRTQ
jgi:hypothetical protein